MRHPTDTDMDFLAECSNDELEFLVRLIIDVGGKTNQLDNSAAFKMHRPDHQKYVGEIIEEIQRYAGNTIRNMLRGYGVPYREALGDTLDDLKVGFDKRQDLCELEELLLRLGLPRYLKLMKNDANRDAFQKVLEGTSTSANPGRESSAEKSAAAVISVLSLVVTGVAGAIALTAPAKRVVVPAIIYIANLRKRHNEGAK